MNTRLYLDANASARIRPQARAAAQEYLGTAVGNASSVHTAGRAQRAALRRAKADILRYLQLERGQAQSVLTSGGTESCQLLLDAYLGGVEGVARFPAHLIVSTIEHAAMAAPIMRLEQLGWEITRIPPQADGRVAVEDFVAALRKNTALVSCMGANNETGALQDVLGLARKLRAAGYGGAIVSDMIQAIGKSDFNGSALFTAGLDAFAVSGHKLGAPAGVGLVVFTKNAERCSILSPSLLGGPQEDRMRAGTENILGAVSLAAATAVTEEQARKEREKSRNLRELLWHEMSSHIAGCHRLSLSEPGACLANTLLCAFDDCRGDDLVVALDLLGLAASTGAACASGKQSRSHVVEEMRLPRELQDNVLRLSLDWDADEALVREAVVRLKTAVERMRRSRSEVSQHAAV